MSKINEERVFLQALKENEDDQDTRMTYANWLEEHDQPEEADRQRKWPAAKAWLLEFANKWNFFEINHPYRRRRYDLSPNTDAFHQILEEAQAGSFLTAMGRDLHYAKELGAGDEEQFWRCVSILTGKQFNEEHKTNFGWSCSC